MLDRYAKYVGGQVFLTEMEASSVLLRESVQVPHVIVISSNR